MRCDICKVVCVVLVLATRANADELAPIEGTQPPPTEAKEDEEWAPPPAWREGLPGPWRGGITVGYPELLGYGIGRTFAADHVRVQVDAGSVLFFLFSITGHVQVLVYRYKLLTTGIGIHGGWIHNPDLSFSESGGNDARSYFVGGARALIEIVPIRRWQHLGFALEGGVSYTKDPLSMASPWGPSLAFRTFLIWGFSHKTP